MKLKDKLNKNLKTSVLILIGFVFGYFFSINQTISLVGLVLLVLVILFGDK